MAEQSKIEWTTHTFNPWIGCTKVSQGCANCYAESLMETRYGKVQWGPNGTRVITSPIYWTNPRTWNRWAQFDRKLHSWIAESPIAICTNEIASYMNVRLDAVQRSIDRLVDQNLVEPGGGNLGGYVSICGYRRPRVFCASLADVFEDWQGPISNKNVIELSTDDAGWPRPLTMNDLRHDLFRLIDETPHLDWLLVTKRPENIRRMWPAVSVGSNQQADDRSERGELYRRNVWLLTSVEDQETADERIPALLKCRDLVPVLGLSCEPLLGQVSLGKAKALPIYHEAETVTDRCGLTGRVLAVRDGRGWCKHSGNLQPWVDWVIVGGESGHDARPYVCEYGWDLLLQCKSAGVPAFHKQLGSNPVCTNDNVFDWPGRIEPPPAWQESTYACGSRIVLKDPKGGDWKEWPEDLRVREFPKVEAGSCG